MKKQHPQAAALRVHLSVPTAPAALGSDPVSNPKASRTLNRETKILTLIATGY